MLPRECHLGIEDLGRSEVGFEFDIEFIFGYK
jgi:hypothetical protein